MKTIKGRCDTIDTALIDAEFGATKLGLEIRDFKAHRAADGMVEWSALLNSSPAVHVGASEGA